ncbi:MAG: 30S ribosomal protein S3 [archaeon]|mgnify:CR=1 FL=1
MIERTFIKKNLNKLEMEDYLSEKLDRAGFSKLEIVKTPLVTRIVLYVAKPGMAIGKSGSTIKQLTETIATKYKIENPQIEIQEIKAPNLDAKVAAEKMAAMIERGFAWRSIAFRIMKDAIDAGAQGVELVVKGKLSGKGGRKRKQRIAHGYMKKMGDQAKLVSFAKAAAYPKAGAIGIRLKIVSPDVIFPDKIDVREVVKKVKAAKKEAKEQLEKAAEKKDAEKENSVDMKAVVEKVVETEDDKKAKDKLHSAVEQKIKEDKK